MLGEIVRAARGQTGCLKKIGSELEGYCLLSTYSQVLGSKSFPCHFRSSFLVTGVGFEVKPRR